MPNANYRNGANYERLVKRKLESQGAWVSRSAGSHGIADLVAIFPSHTDSYHPDVWLVNIKRRKDLVDKDEVKQLYMLCSKLNVQGWLAYREKRINKTERIV